jgi:hypothetical protein
MSRGASSGKIALIARSGYAARGVVYLIVGGLAVAAALGGGRATGAEGALTTILQQPFGQILLGIVALGLLGYAVWRTVQAVADTDHHGTDAKGVAIRGGLGVSAVTHTLLAIFALSLIFGWGSSVGGGDGNSTQDWTAWLLQQPFGRWLVGLIDVAVIGAGLAHMVKGYKAKFEKYLQMDRSSLEKASPVCRFGLIARGIVFLIIGGFFVVAAWRFSSGEVRGLKGALDVPQQQPYGWLLLAVVALGLFAFGLYSLVEARYRRIDEPSLIPGRSQSAWSAKARPRPRSVEISGSQPA